MNEAGASLEAHSPEPSNVEAGATADQVVPSAAGVSDVKHARVAKRRTVSIADTVAMIRNNRDEEDNILPPRKRKVKRELVIEDSPSANFYVAERQVKAATTAAVADKSWTGKGFTEKAMANKDVDPLAVSIGSQIVAELVREPGNNLVNIVNKATGLNYSVEQLLTDEGLRSFIDAINESKIYVIASKSPVPNPESSQKRLLRVHSEARGIWVHPTQTKIYNLDFDGDGVSIQFSLDGSLFHGPMDYLINTMNEPVIDLDFFPIPDLMAIERDGFINIFGEMYLPEISGKGIRLDDLAGAFYDVMFPPDGEDQTDLLRDFIHEMDKVASMLGDREVALSDILKACFDVNLFLKTLQVQSISETNPDRMSDIVPESEADDYVTMVINDMSLGTLPPNFQDFLIGLGRYIGEVPGKNVMFRLGADVAKRIKFSGNMFKGEEGARDLYELTLEAGMAAFMSSRMNLGEKVNYIQRIAKRQILDSVGFPDSVDQNGNRLYPNLIDFLRRFAIEYNRLHSMIDMAKVEFGCDLDPVYSTVRDTAIHGNRITDLAQPLISVYGDYTVERMFPGAFSYVGNIKTMLRDGGEIRLHAKGRTLLPRYRRTTLSKLSRDNRIAVDYKALRKKSIENCEPIDLVFAIADKRRTKSSKFHRELESLLDNYTKAMKDFKSHYDSRGRNQADFMAYASDMMSCLHLSGPDMFAYYGMDSPSLFINRPFGRLMRSAAAKDDASDHMGGVRMTMVVQYRMRRISDINDEIDRLMKEEDNLLYTIPRINRLQNELLNELSIIGASSDLWSVLAQEVDGDTSAWDTLVESKGDLTAGKTNWCDSASLPKAKSGTYNFWNPEKDDGKLPWCGRYHSLMDVMIDPYIPMSVKEKVAADVVRQSTGFYQIAWTDMSYQLEIGPHSNYTSLATMAYQDQPNILSDIEKSNNRFKSFFKNDWEAVQQDVKRARAMSQAGDLDSYVKNLAEDPEFYVSVDDYLIVDAINAQMNKTSKSAEKSSQEVPVDALYNALSLQRGGLTNIMYRADARTVGMIPEAHLSALDVITVLADPERSFTIYNGSGRWTLSRAALCGDNSEEALWRLLEDNPRIASLLRPGMATVASSGKVYKNSSFNERFMSRISRKDILRGKVKAQLTDRPMFLAMVAMFRPQAGRNSRSLREDTKNSLNALLETITLLGWQVSEGKRVNAREVLKAMGVTVDSLQKIGGMDKTAALNWYADMAECLNRYVSETASIIEKGDFKEEARTILDKDDEVFDNKRELDRAVWGKTLALTGHRPKDLSDVDMEEVADRLKRYCQENDIDTIISGMALGFDQVGAQVAIDLGIRLVAAVPCDGQDSKWDKKDVAAYQRLLDRADQVKKVSPGEYSARKLQLRNEWMVDNADEVFALFNGKYYHDGGKTSGTGNCVGYAKEVRKPVYRLDPNDLDAGVVLMEKRKDPPTPAPLRFDNSSVALAIDVRQTMTGAKTETSTDIEGGITQENLGIALWGMSIRDRFTVIDGSMPKEELSQYVGCMTNAGVFNGENIEELELSLPESTPLVVELPEGMLRQDKTLDDNEHFQVSSLGRYMIEKRTKATEELNLKAKKAGDDGLDSITKRTRYLDKAKENVGIVENVYDNEGLFAAIMKLANFLRLANVAEGYKDMDLADYANIASVMIKEVADPETGETTMLIRSLGEISAAVRGNMDQAVVENGTPKERIQAAANIADNVGLDILFSRNAALFAVSAIGDAKTGTFSPAKNVAMSSKERSFLTLWKMAEEEHLKLPWGGKTFKPSIKMMSNAKRDRIQNAIVEHLDFPIGMTNYKFIGFVGRNRHIFNDSPGQTSVWYIEKGAAQQDIDTALRHCYSYGMTLAFHDLSDLGDKAEFFEKDITPAPFGVGEDLIMLPFFDMRMNRSAISGPMAPPSFQFDPSWVWTSVEDSLNLYGLSDADALIASETVDRCQCNAGSIESISLDNLFFNTRGAYPDKVGRVEFCTRQEIEDNIVNWIDGGPTIDFGIADVNPNYERIIRKFGIQLDEYRSEFAKADEAGFLPESRPDRIVGWVKCHVGNYAKPVYAPIIPFPTGERLRVPTKFRIGDYAIDEATDSFKIPWRISEDLEGQYCKVHDGSGAAGKTMVMFRSNVDLGRLRCGRPIDMVTAAMSFATRRLAWGKRMCTLKTLAMTMALPPYGYNYAEHPDSFPDNPDLKKRLVAERIPLEEWPDLISKAGRLSSDPEIDSLLRKMVGDAIKTGTINPSDILATRFGDRYAFMYVDYDFLFETDLGFQNALMKWYHSMQETVCPPSIDDYYDRADGKGYLFKPIVQGKDEYERGCLQMAIPHKGQDGRIFWHWENVYMSFSFFNDDYSGLNKIGLNGAGRTMEQLNAIAISGKRLKGRNMDLFTKNVAAQSFRVHGPNDIELDYGRFISKER